MDWFDLLSTNNFLTINKTLIKLLGLNCAVLIAELMSQCNVCQKSEGYGNGSFCTTTEKIKENTGLDEAQQKIELAKLKEIGVLEYGNLNISREKHFKFNQKALCRVLTNGYTQESYESNDCERNELFENWLDASNLTREDLLKYKTADKLQVHEYYDGFALFANRGKSSKKIGCGLSGVSRQEAKELFMYIGSILDYENNFKTHMAESVLESFKEGRLA